MDQLNLLSHLWFSRSQYLFSHSFSVSLLLGSCYKIYMMLLPSAPPISRDATVLRAPPPPHAGCHSSRHHWLSGVAWVHLNSCLSLTTLLFALSLSFFFGIFLLNSPLAKWCVWSCDFLPKLSVLCVVFREPPAYIPAVYLITLSCHVSLWTLGNFAWSCSPCCCGNVGWWCSEVILISTAVLWRAGEFWTGLIKYTLSPFWLFFFAVDENSRSD